MRLRLNEHEVTNREYLLVPDLADVPLRDGCRRASQLLTSSARAGTEKMARVLTELDWRREDALTDGQTSPGNIQMLEIVRYATLSVICWREMDIADANAPSISDPDIGIRDIPESLKPWIYGLSRATTQGSLREPILGMAVTGLYRAESDYRHLAHALAKEGEPTPELFDPEDLEAALEVVAVMLDTGTYSGFVRYTDVGDVLPDLLAEFGERPTVENLASATVDGPLVPDVAQQTVGFSKVLWSQMKGCVPYCHSRLLERRQLAPKEHADLLLTDFQDDSEDGAEFRAGHALKLPLRIDKLALHKIGERLIAWPNFDPYLKTDPYTGSLTKRSDLGGIRGCPAVPNRALLRQARHSARLMTQTRQWQEADSTHDLREGAAAISQPPVPLVPAGRPPTKDDAGELR